LPQFEAGGEKDAFLSSGKGTRGQSANGETTWSWKKQKGGVPFPFKRKKKKKEGGGAEFYYGFQKKKKSANRVAARKKMVGEKKESIP